MNFVKKIFLFLYKLHGQALRYFIVGTSTVILDLLGLIFLKEIIKLNAVLAVAINLLFIFAYNFSLNKYWTFKNHSLPHRQFIRYLAVAAFNYIFSVGTMYVFHELFGFDYRLVRLGSVALMVTGNFFLSKYWIYHD